VRVHAVDWLGEEYELMIRALIQVQCCRCQSEQTIDKSPIHAMPSRRVIYKLARQYGFHYSSLHCNWLCDSCWKSKDAD
jgi:hypothetical protein